jgi:hypothetical protein
MWLVGTFHSILELAVTFWQFFSDDVCASWNFLARKRSKKHSLTDLELISRHDVPANQIIILPITAKMGRMFEECAGCNILVASASVGEGITNEKWDRGSIMRSVLSLALSCFLIVENIAALAQSRPGNLSPGDFDLACAVVAGAEMGASQNEQNIPRRDMAVTILTFYLGRLSGRDDTKDWNAIVRGRVAELQEAVRSRKLLDACLDFYISKIK